MREIKFRVFSDKTGMWSWNRLTVYHPLSCLYSHDGWQVMQFTGLKDKNGVEIFEGDILGPCVINGSVVNASVIFNGGRFLVSALQGETWAEELFRYVGAEVIGNLYENQELISPAPQTIKTGAEKRI